MSNHPLGRRVPPDFHHVEKYPLQMKAGVALNVTKPAPVVVGINWYDSFDNPIKIGRSWWAGTDPNHLGEIRGGHCVCMPHKGFDSVSRYNYYNQGREGACVGFGSSRAMSILNSKLYDAKWLWNEAKKGDIWPDTNPGDDNGTSVRAAMDVLRTQGHVKKGSKTPVAAEGIVANRWAININDLFSVLQNPVYKEKGAIPFLNSWGSQYPRLVWVPCETWARLLNEDGEFTMVTDR